nr:PREDICTED: uncharacterized protein LOC109031830 [Bemisia tabaci]
MFAKFKAVNLFLVAAGLSSIGILQEADAMAPMAEIPQPIVNPPIQLTAERQAFFDAVRSDPCPGFFKRLRPGFMEEANKVCATAKDNYLKGFELKDRKNCLEATDAMCIKKFFGFSTVCAFSCAVKGNNQRWMTLKEVAGW